jgi:hypothetical protein
MDLFFNELSLSVAPDRFEARTNLHQLGELYKVALTKGLSEIKVARTFFSHCFAPDYIFDQWLGDNNVDQDLRTLLKSKITTTPSIEDMLLDREKSSDTLFESYYNGDPAIGLGAASPYLFDSIAVSISHVEINWSLDFVGIDLLVLESSGMAEKPCSVRHILDHSHLATHSDWLKIRIRPSIPNGKILWLKRGNLYPNLIFCEKVQPQLAQFNGNQPEFIQLQKRLEELEIYAAQRETGHFDPDELPTKVTPESETRKEDFASELIQKCPDGETRLFSWHSRFTPRAGRVHFYPLEDSQSIIIGSIANQNTIK